jgi:hypothetical protein
MHCIGAVAHWLQISAQYGLLCAMQSEQQIQLGPPTLFLRHLRASRLTQQRANAACHVHFFAPPFPSER